MKIELHEIPVRDVVAGYRNSNEAGVVGYGGRLNIRPAFQREFVYKDQQREEVMRTINNGFPLNVMYWAKSENNTFELLDGQQRTLSICQYIDNGYSLDHRFYNNLTTEEKDKILSYKLMIYICEGTAKEKLDWFRIINIAGEKLTDQELRNAMYTGEWLSNAKRYFSKNNCAAYKIADKYLKGKAIRQEYLETALKWISARDNIQIEDYMAIHQNDTNCAELWLYFKAVIDWVEVLFPVPRYKFMNGIDWGILYNKYHNNSYDPQKLEQEIKRLIEDEEITNQKGIYEYVFDHEERHLNLRKFPVKIARAVYEEQKGVCKLCNEHFEFEEMQADHILPWSKGGKTTKENCQMLCASCNRKKRDI